jgi:hypothetical protein
MTGQLELTVPQCRLGCMLFGAPRAAFANFIIINYTPPSRASIFFSQAKNHHS